MHDPEERPIESLCPSGQPSVEGAAPVAFGAVIAVLACLMAAWIAAGSIGLLAHPLRRALTLVALGAALLAPGICPSRCWPRTALTPLVAGVAAYLVFLAAPTANIMAPALVLAFLSLMAKEQNRDALQAAAVAVAVLGLYHFGRTSIPWMWLAADRAGQGFGGLVGVAIGRRMYLGATFAGLDCLIVMAVLWALYARSTSLPRAARSAYGFAAILVGHVLYLIVLSHIPHLETTLAQGSGPSFLAGLLRQAVPWNVPVLACTIQLVIAAAMLRWSRWSFLVEIEQTGRPVAWAAARLALGAAALAMALLLPVTTAFHPRPLTLEGKKIVFYEKGFLNWLKPTHDMYGRLASGMYGMLPAFVESLGARCVVSPDLSDADLNDADALVLIFPDEPWSDDQLDRIHSFVRQGGSLLVLGEHTTVDANGSNRFNEVLAPTAMRVRFDSATFAVGGWLHSYEPLQHPATAGIDDDRNEFGVVIGASVQADWPARPLLVGRWGWADHGDEASDRALMGNSRYDTPEKLGDIVLAAEQPFGKGRVVVFGDTSSLSNGINVSSHVFTSRLFAYLAGRRNAHPAWRQFVGIVVGAFLIVLLCRRSSPWRTALVAVGLSVSLMLCLAAVPTTADLLPDGRITAPNNLAYLDASGLSAYSGESWRPDGTGGLALTLMRNGYMPLSLAELTPPRLQRAGLLICGARSRGFSANEVETVEQFVERGGLLVLTIGYDRASASQSLLRRFGSGIGADDGTEPAPLGHFKSPYLEAEGQRVYVRFHAAWPVRCDDPNARVIAYGRDNQPVVVLRRVGSGKVVLIGDTFFATNQNLELEDGTPFEGLRENADFWRWLIALLRDEQVWIPPALQSAPPNDAAQEVSR
ncbi:MAG: hypothetical protein JW993_12810 [Sedimentisphaerales bacterium]|nr:hypothetical protein [Sedimentisphaerales bacterium]